MQTPVSRCSHRSTFCKILCKSPESHEETLNHVPRQFGTSLPLQDLTVSELQSFRYGADDVSDVHIRVQYVTQTLPSTRGVQDKITSPSMRTGWELNLGSNPDLNPEP
ncbi:hypothetical protein MPTK1_7g06090 [Marchantia polymorpha subsp. ruderalis]|uniref:Uncharacterized protein n=2 Tax=Marchantia polymorpha TaxID=3197 RepID=A0AAF6BWN1_MARPO|nr:hypothetical protein MARPO_0057s0062 [Marchantia polymorpha]BBN16415.1 hypothetical protein Mp_7g06090 [Marchantia polymorpha subsp. ruderalis]|eukprot:PTQ37427.1 hypothetical protein MARPO_0057s0062 [Marchantia polymorpha]